jgi:hypothetical protein
MRLKKCLILIVAGFLHCNNFGLADKLQNPGSSSSNTSVKETFTDNFYIFVSSWMTQGDMSGQTYSDCAAFTGPAKADCSCTRAAAAGGLRKHSTQAYKAYLGLAGAPNLEPKCRALGMAGGCSPNIVGPWFNTMGNVVINNANELTGSIQNPIRFTEFKNDVGMFQVWTGVAASGNYFNECTGWNNTATTNINVGATDQTNTSWQFVGTQNCNTAQRIYCMAVP